MRQPSSILSGILALLLCSAGTAEAQLSAYGSVSYGYNANPLCNYERQPDRLVQNYLELGYAREFKASDLLLRYSGGLVSFSDLSGRTYYEHTLGAGYTLRFGERAKEESDGESEDDSSASYLGFGVSGSARHDRSAFQEYDNTSLSGNCGYRVAFSPAGFLRLVVSSEYRAYTYLGELSNLTSAVRASVGFHLGEHVTLEIAAGGGLKRYVGSVYDTVLQTTQTTVAQPTGTGNGNGHGRGNINGNGNGSGASKLVVVSEEHLLVNPGSNGISQIAAGLTLTGTWEGTLCSFQASYRYDPSAGGPRYLAQYANSSTLHEDIYNDSYNSSGPLAVLSVSRELPARFRIALEAVAGASRFDAPAMDLSGDQTAGRRLDRRTSCEITVAHTFDLWAGLNLEAGITGRAERNQSNDVYNDYSLTSLAVSLGIGF